MKFLIAVASLLWGLAGVCNVALAREVYNVGSGWTFFTSDDPSTDAAATVNLPHTHTSAGTLNYLKNIDVPLAWEGRRIFLRTGGAARVAHILVDGIHTATHRGGGSAFTVEITDRVRPGSPASVRIVVDSSPGLDVLPTAGREKIYGGIFRTVELIVCDPLSVSPSASLIPGDSGGRTAAAGPDTSDGIWISTERLTPARAEGSVSLALLTPDSLPSGAMARVRFIDAEGNIAAQNSAPVTGNSRLSIPFTLSDPHLWQGVADPYLYDVEVTLSGAGGLLTDSVRVTTGFRTVGVDRDNNFTLNGTPLRIHGVVLGRDRQTVGTALTPFHIEEDIDLILEMGANAVRVSGGPHSDYFYRLCDESGLLVWNDGPFTGAAYPTDIDFVDTDSFRANGLAQMTEMISQLYNHPSVVAWGVFSNVTTRGGDPVPYIRELTGLVRRLDRGARLTAASSVVDGEANFITDIVSFDLSLGWESGLPDGVSTWLEQLRGGWPDLRAGISFGAGGSILQQSERLERPSPTSGFHPEGWQTFFHEEYIRHAVDSPGLWGVFVCNMFDSGAAKSWGGTPSQSGFGSGEALDDRGLVTFDRKDRKDAFWLYKANWNLSEPFVRIAGSRLDVRGERRQSVRVYSNRPEVELFVGGRSQGRRAGENGIFVWENVTLRPGVNRLEARTGSGFGSGSGSGSGENSHRISITLSSSASSPLPPSSPAAAVTVPSAIPLLQ